MLLLLALMALGRRLQLRKLLYWTNTWEAPNHTLVVRRRFPLSLALLSFCGLVFISKMRRYTGVDVILLCDFFLDQPWSSGPRISSNGLFDKGSQDLLCEDFSIPHNMRVVHHCFLCRSIVEADKVSREGWADGAIRQKLASKTCFVADSTGKSLSSDDVYGDCLARIVV